MPTRSTYRRSSKGDGADRRRKCGDGASERRGRSRPTARYLDRYEREARRAGDDFERAEGPIEFSPRSPARPVDLSGRGRPLPGELRAQLEARFGADLGAVRLHDHPSAHALAEAEGARALASGADIVFSKGALDTSSRAGRRLIAHEVTHVLQQTARRDPDGRWHARRIHGTASIQADGSTEESQEEPPSGLSENVFDTLERRYREQFGREDADLEAVIGRAEEAFERDDENVIESRLEDLERDTSDDLDTYSRAARSFLFDLFKFTGLHDAALRLVERYWGLFTVAYDGEFADYLLENLPDEAYVAPFVENTALQAAGIWPDAYRQAVLDFLLDPRERRLELPVDRVGNFVRYRFEQRAGGREIDLINERYVMAMWKLLVVTEDIEQGFNEALAEREDGREGRSEDDGADQHVTRPTVGDRIALSSVAHSFFEEERHERAGRTRGEIYTQLIDAAAVARRRWQLIVDAEARQQASLPRGRFGFEEAVESAPVDFGPLPDDHPVPTFVEDLSDVADTFFEKTAKLRTIDDYGRSVSQFREELQSHREPLLEAAYAGYERPRELFEELSRSGRRAARGERSRGILILELWRQSLEDLLADAAPDAEFVDEQLRHRHRVARSLAQMARTFGGGDGWSGLHDVARSALRAEDIAESYAYVIGDWERDTSATLSDLSQVGSIELTVGDGDDKENLSLSPSVLIQIYDLVRLEVLESGLEAALEVDDDERQGTLDEVRDRVEALTPQKWAAEGVAYVFAHEDRRRDDETGDLEPAVPPGDLLAKNQKTREQFIGQMDDDDLRLFSRESYSAAWGWILPSPVRLLEPLNDLFERHGMSTFDTDVGPIDAVAQLARLVSLLDEERLVAPAHFMIEGRRRQIRRELPALRGLLLVRWAKDALEAAADYDGEHPHLVVDDVLSRVHANIEAFGSSFDDRRLREVHIASVMHGIASDLSPLLSGRVTYEHIITYLPLIETALDHTPEGEEEALVDFNYRQGARRYAGGEIDFDDGEALEALREELRGTAEEVRSEFGMRGDADADELREAEGRIVWGREEPIVLDGISYEVREVHRSFVYHPGYGDVVESTLEVDGESRPASERSGERLLTVTISEAETDVYDTDERLLDLLSTVVERRNRLEQLREVQAHVEFLAEASLEVVEFVPGAGQIFMVVRAIIEGADFKDIKDELIDATIEKMDALVGSLDPDRLTPDMFWMYFLFGDGDPFAALQPSDEDEEPSRRRRRRRKKKGLGSVKRLGERMVRTIESVGYQFSLIQERVRSLVKGKQAFIVNRPTLAWAIGLLAELLSWVADQQGGDDDDRGVADRMLDPIRRLMGMVGEMVNTFAALEVPDEIVDRSELVAALRRVVVARLPKKAEMPLEGLDALGLTDMIDERIAESLDESTVDPNTHWREHVLPHLQEQLEYYQPLLLETVKHYLEQLEGHPLLEGLDIDFPEVEIQSPRVVDDETEDEAQPTLDDGVERPRRASRPADSSGRPLPSSLRESAERRFGHDFGHVRLHRDSEAGRWTRSVGAKALTSGSRIYLRPDHDPRRGAGRRVLDHELAHVLQQTGPRPLGGDYGVRPRRGRPGRGVRWQPRAERDADQMAETVWSRHRHSQHPPMPVEGSDAEGLQPSPDDYISLRTVERFFRELSDEQTPLEEHDVERSDIDVSSDADPSEANLHPAVEHLGEQLQDEIDGLDKGQVEKRFQKPWEEDSNFSSRLLARRGSTHAAVYFNRMVLMRAEDDVLFRKVERTTGEGDERRELYVLDVDSFVERFRYFALAALGLDIDVSLSSSGDEAIEVEGERRGGDVYYERGSGEQSRQIDNLDVEGLSVDRLNPLAFDKRSIVWQLLMEWEDPGFGAGNDDLTWEKAIESVTDGEQASDIDDEQLYQTTRRRVRSQGLGGLWHGEEFSFTSAFKEAVVELVTAEDEAEEAAIQKLPSWSEYVEPTWSSGDDPFPALHIGPHSKTTRAGRGLNRNSHHLIPYIFIEYFRNEASPPAFRSDFDYPGLEGGSDDPKRVRSGSTTLELEKLYRGRRADAMAAISLYVETHQTLETTISLTASDIDNWFRQHLDENYEAAVRDGEQVDDQDPEQHLVEAMRRTYAEVHRKSLGPEQAKLIGPLQNREIRKYEEWADQKRQTEELTSGYSADPADVSHVVSRAVEEVDDIMNGRHRDITFENDWGSP